MTGNIKETLARSQNNGTSSPGGGAPASDGTGGSATFGASTTINGNPANPANPVTGTNIVANIASGVNSFTVNGKADPAGADPANQTTVFQGNIKSAYQGVNTLNFYNFAKLEGTPVTGAAAGNTPAANITATNPKIFFNAMDSYKSRKFDASRRAECRWWRC
ncbi:hypothetical protein [Helicobacter mustelae]|uniref:Putative Hsr recombination casette n=1 Tax=Helicobacter mustelae (strain ATCC 43772 / CCUG 25715 / CIP 103759 / LMG 18044 / NCTC 12198 / R85-136P) TaxID=679897 RepID=D3UI05_HELM1|nr:hypothetical protein [Helicobacter mustelae]CBG40128.1 putative Hsr recombination casette [Helicobacter mustelae 12198]SQH71634.1 Hsr recombination casette protein [Helicobacter mustelae]